MSDWSRAWRIGRRELDWRFRGLRLLFVCLVLGVAALATVGSLAEGIDRGLGERGQLILGGDVEFSRSARPASPEELAALSAVGRVSASVRMQSTASAAGQFIPIQLKAVDAAYPLYGKLTLANGRAAGPPPPGNVWIDQSLVGRLPVGSRFRLGAVDFTVGGVIGDEPDRLGEGFSLGPVVIMSLGELPKTGLAQAGSLFEQRYRIATVTDSNAFATQFKQRFAQGGWESKTRDRAAPGAERFISRMTEFLTLVVLAALVIAGIGIANAVASYLRARQANIATLKILGADAATIIRIYGMQLAWVVGLATILGLMIGVAAVPIAGRAAGDVLPVPLDGGIAWAALTLAAGFGLLAAIAAAAVPLIRGATVSAASLLRGSTDPRRPPLRKTLPWIAAPAAIIVTLALATASRLLFTAGFLASVAGVLAVLALLGWAVRVAAARLPRPSRPLLRLALAGLHRPGSGTVALVVALGVGLTMFVLIAAIRSSFDSNLARNIPERAPSLFALDVPRERAGEFVSTVRSVSKSADVQLVPLLRGTITGYGSTEVSNLKQIPEGAWALRGERGLTYSDRLPAGSTLVAGNWWSPNYSGPPLVSVDERLRDAIGLKLGDELRFTVLGVQRHARIASFRRIDWDTLGFNFVLVFSPNALADVPHNMSATITGPASDDARVSRAIGSRFPSTSLILVREVLAQVADVARSISIAIAWAASITIFAGIAVLIGTFAAMREARTYDGVILRMLGATRRDLLLLQTLELVLLAAVVAIVALALGLAGGWLVVTILFDFVWAPDLALIGATILIGLAVILAVGLAGSLPSLNARPSRALRSL